MTWREAVERGWRRCCMCWSWHPIAELTRHEASCGTKAESTRVSVWFVCFDCGGSDELQEGPLSERVAVDPSGDPPSLGE
jgi:hypothetical protein